MGSTVQLLGFQRILQESSRFFVVAIGDGLQETENKIYAFL